MVIVAPGCGPAFVQPSVYPNDYLKRVGDAQLERDLTDCNDLASTYVKDRDKYNQLARDTATGAVVGSASGALAGVIIGDNVGRAVGAGAAVGAIIPILQSLFTSDDASPDRETFVETCLRDRGYQVL